MGNPAHQHQHSDPSSLLELLILLYEISTAQRAKQAPTMATMSPVTGDLRFRLVQSLAVKLEEFLNHIAPCVDEQFNTHTKPTT